MEAQEILGEYLNKIGLVPAGRLNRSFVRINCQTCGIRGRAQGAVEEQTGWWLFYRLDSIGLIWDLRSLVTTLIRLIEYKVAFSLLMH